MAERLALGIIPGTGWRAREIQGSQPRTRVQPAADRLISCLAPASSPG